MTTTFPKSFSVDLDDITFVGHDLHRPECALAAASGALYVPDWRGCLTIIQPDGGQRLISGKGDGPASGTKPNGIALRRDGSFLFAQLDDAEGGVWSLDRDGTMAPWLTQVDGQPLPPTNFVFIDGLERVWITVSTRMIPRTLARTPTHSDGFIVLVDERGARIVADDIGFTNEAKVDPSGTWLYVNETFGRRISRFRISEDGSLADRETYAQFGPGVFPDGLDFDVEGGIWITSVFSNRLIRIDPDGGQQLILEDNDPAFLDEIEAQYRSGALAERPPEKIPSRILGNISNIVFGCPDLRTVYLGCLQDSRIATFRSPIAGAPPPYWQFG